MREDVEFDAEGVTLRGWLYLPDGAARPVPTVVMAHGFSAVKEMYLDSLGGACAARGSGGDYRHAITWAQTRPEVDGDRIGVWGTSYSGGHVLVLGAIDQRVRC